MKLTGKVALITGGANGFGRATGARLRAAGAEVVLADIETGPGEEAAAELGAAFVRCDVTVPEDSAAAVAFTLECFGGIDFACLNAGIATGVGLVEDFDLERYRRAMAVNLDGVVFGLNAVVPAMRERDGGSIVATASLAGLAPAPFDPIYAANKHAVVGLTRSFGPVLASEGIRFNAVCPGFAATRLIDLLKDYLEAGGAAPGVVGSGSVGSEGVPIIPVEKVVDGIVGLLGADVSGECHFVQAGIEPQNFRFRNVPGPREPDSP